MSSKSASTHLVRIPQELQRLISEGFRISGSIGSYSFRFRGGKTQFYKLVIPRRLKKEKSQWLKSNTPVS